MHRLTGYGIGDSSVVFYSHNSLDIGASTNLLGLNCYLIGYENATRFSNDN